MVGWPKYASVWWGVRSYPKVEVLICMQCMSNCMSYYEQQKSLQGLSFVLRFLKGNFPRFDFFLFDE